jgi:hypothetical protein
MLGERAREGPTQETMEEAGKPTMRTPGESGPGKEIAMQWLTVGSCLKCLRNKEKVGARCQWLTPVIAATQEAEIRRIKVQSQPGQIVCKTLS